ncbi:MAG TPA: o-succinylbenzoate synthase [Stenomitos sp.]
MTGLRLHATPYEAAFRRPVVTARATYQTRRGWFVTLRDGEGREGVGEVAPLPEFGTESPERAVACLERLGTEGLPLPESDDWEALGAVLKTAGLTPEEFPSTYAGLELALLDRAARARGVSLARYIAPEARDRQPVQRLLVEMDLEALATEATTMVCSGYTTLKLKVGVSSLAQDFERVRTVRAAVGNQVRIRLDANGAWSPHEAMLALDAFIPLGIDLFEQPIVYTDPVSFAALRGRGVDIAADEALVRPAVARELISRRATDALVLKPMVLGGLGVALKLAQEAHEQGLRVVVTSSLDQVVGVAGALHLACALPGEPEPSGLATLGLFAERSPELPVVNGAIALPEGPGLGVSAPLERG